MPEPGGAVCATAGRDGMLSDEPPTTLVPQPAQNLASLVRLTPHFVQNIVISFGTNAPVFRPMKLCQRHYPQQ
jgi:hypothetical protein